MFAMSHPHRVQFRRDAPPRAARAFSAACPGLVCFALSALLPLGIVCGVMSRCGLQAHSTVGVWVCVGIRVRGHVTLRAASPQHGWRMGVRGDSCAGSCAAAGYKPAAEPGNRRYLGKSGQDRQPWTTCAIVHSVHTVHSSLRGQQCSMGDRLPLPSGCCLACWAAAA
jgi:hypothetical protein